MSELTRKKNEASEIMFAMVDSTTPANLKSGLTVTDTPYYKDGAGAWTALSIADASTEIGSTGMYTIEMTAAELNHDLILIKLTSTGAADTIVVIRTTAHDIDDANTTTPPTVIQIRQEMDTNSTKMAPSQTLSEYKATGFSTHSAADVKTAIEQAGSSIASILEDTGDLQTNQGGWTTADVSALATTTALSTAQTDLDTITGSDGVTLATTQALYAPNKVVPDIAGTAATPPDVATALSDINLDHLMKVAVDTDFATTVHLDSVIGQLADVGTSATFDRTTDALEAIRNVEPHGSPMVGTNGANTVIPDAVGTAAGLHATTDGKIGVVDGNVDAILVDTGTTLENHMIDIKGTGFVKDTHSLPQCITATGFATATVCTEARLAELDAANLPTDVTNIEADTQDLQTQIGTAGAGLGDLGGMSVSMMGEVQTKVNDALTGLNLDHLIKDPVDTSFANTVHLDSALGHMVGVGGSATFDRTTDSHEAIRNRGDDAWTTGGAGSISEILNVQALIPNSIDLANTATVRIALGLTNMVDDLPSTTEITPGTITIDHKAIGATSWTTVVNAAACSELAGLVYYDEVFDTATGYTAGDSIRITFKSQKITVDANDFEITGADGWTFQTHIREAMRGTDLAALAATWTDEKAAFLDHSIATAQADLDTITGSDGVTLASQQLNYAPNTIIPDAMGTAAGLHATTDGKVDAVQTDTTAIKAKTDNLPSGMAKNVAVPKFDVFMVLSSDHVTGATGKTVTGTISKDGGAFTALTNAITEVDAGMYTIASGLTQEERNADVSTLKFSADGCDDRIITIISS